ncbi:MAG: T9SS type A sorting domain-containing protein, partial [Bacteroidia bacterium]
QRINSSGVVQWSANGLVICNAINTQSNPKLRSDGVGGATIAWQDKRGGIDYDVYAQRISSTGSLQWTANGIAVTAVAGAQSAVDMTNESLGTDIIITWKDDRNGNYDIYAQKLDALGNALWMANGLALTASASNQVNPNAVGDGAGGAIITWQDTVIDYDIYAQRVDLSGNLLWGGNGIAVANAIDDQTSPKNVSDGTGGSIFVWEDHRNGTDMDVYAQRISAAGIPLGLDQYKGPDQALVTSNYPNPFAASTTIRITGTDHSSPDLSVNITDLLGKAQKFSVTRSGNEFSINAENMGSGTYIYKIFSGKAVIGTGKLTVIK